MAWIQSNYFLEKLPHVALLELKRNAEVKARSRMSQVVAVLDTMAGWKPSQVGRGVGVELMSHPDVLSLICFDQNSIMPTVVLSASEKLATSSGTHSGGEAGATKGWTRPKGLEGERCWRRNCFCPG